MEANQRKEIEERVASAGRWIARWRAWFHYIRYVPLTHTEGQWAKLCDQEIEQRHGGRWKDLVSEYEIIDLSALDAAEARAVAAESNIVGIVEYREDACMFATIGSFDPTKNRWALHWHTTLEAAEKFAESMTRHGAPALAVEIKRFFKAQGSGE